MDFGVMRESYASDLQRVWCFLGDGEESAPAEVAQTWSSMWAARRSQSLLDLFGLSPDWPSPETFFDRRGSESNAGVCARGCARSERSRRSWHE